MSRPKKNEAEEYVKAASEYMAETQATSFELRAFVVWARTNGRITDDIDLVQWHMKRAGDALKRSGEDGERHWYAVREAAADANGTKGEGEEGGENKLVQRTLWGHRDTAPNAFLVRAIEQDLDRVRKDFAAVKRHAEELARRKPRLEKRLNQLLLNFDVRGEL